jgi:methionine aminotransferase
LQFPDYSIPWDEVRSKLSSRIKAIIINSPHNPTGSVLREEDIVQLRKTVEGTDIFIISDEVYEHLVFDDLPHLSMLRYADLMERSFVCFSFGKTYNCTGWKLGYCVSPSKLMEEFRKVHQFNCFSCNSPAQAGIAAYLDNKDAYLNLGKVVQQKRDYFEGLMRQTSFKPLPSHGSYFQCYSYGAYSNEGDKEFALKLVERCGVVTIPVSVFYKNSKDDKVVRFCFAKKEETLRMAVDKLLDLDVGMVD